ncbi:MAG: tRNA (N6-isopentenyl adenosine(37)-C2)-methylthiotransferase MiaB [Deltaproteobacteria bacterium]|nr:MAG: tRNA (N6-isopentenyl adenosine(37)-C2)-methylthiotransferase MiaB [Deltaproteobacteria bacterium]TDJ07462.1 MAG: tRNA (N6-isopentenyl adenosine(37)-C2)-methylthiotransferase MiaB [Deltaproteobacteria bacterium]
MGRRFHLRTFGCQMNQHDAQKISNLLLHEGFSATEELESADLVLIHTCSVRAKAEQKLYSELGALSALKQRRAGLIIGVGGCVAQQEGDRLLARFPHLDFVFGPQNIVHLPKMIGVADVQRSLRVDYSEDPQERFELPERHPEYTSPTPGRAFVTVMEGCDLFCSFCVVPRTRGREVSRPSASILGEVRALAERGVIEVTLLGQTVNAYGRPRPGRVAGEVAFAELIRAVAAVPGIQRVRFTSPHPIFVGDDLIACYADVPELCPHLHLPVQSGSSRVLSAMRRRYDRDDYLKRVERLRRARADLALTTDVIVGFPGETREDFEQTLSLVRELAFVDSFSFKYSPRPGTPAVRAGLEPIDPAEAQSRLEELQALQRSLTLAAHERRVGSSVRVLVEGASRHGAGQRCGRCPYNRIVNFSSREPVPAGTLVDVDIHGATPHSLLGEVPVKRTNLELPCI